MECEENGGGVLPAEGRRGVKRKWRAGGARGLRLAVAPPVPRAPRRRPVRRLPGAARPPHQPQQPPQPRQPRQPCDLARALLAPFAPPASPFMSNMDDIAFWVYTKQAPCLYKYNNIYKKQNDEAHCSKLTKPAATPKSPSVTEPSPKKKRRKLRLLDEESVSSERQQNVYFETSQKQNHKSQTTLSESNGSDVDFNIRNSSIKNKSKATKLQKNNRTTLHKKNKIITSTPKVTGLRRSLRKAQQNLNNNSQLNCSYEILNASAINGDLKPDVHVHGDNVKSDRDHASNNKKETIPEKLKNDIVPNGQFEDLSDVSGFTANYIRSTKLNSKTPRKVRSKASRNLVRESQQKLQKDESKIIVCVNKSVNTPDPNPGLNRSTDSSHVVNLMTVKNNEKSLKVNKSTSLLKFMDTTDQNKNSEEKDIKKNLNVSFQSKSSGISRYPTRYKNNSRNTTQDLAISNNRNSSAKKKGGSRVMAEINNVDGNDNPSPSFTPKTRNGKRRGLMQNDNEASQQCLNNSTDKVSSTITLNVAGPENSAGKKKRNSSTRGAASAKKSADKRQRLKRDSVSESIKRKGPGGSVSSSSPAKCVNRVNKTVTKTRQSLKKDSLRDKSGFAACFSDSDNDSEPLIRRKFFC